jgi:hypothetical protein
MRYGVQCLVEASEFSMRDLVFGMRCSVAVLLLIP